MRVEGGTFNRARSITGRGDPVKVAIIQTNAGRDKEKNIKRAVGYVKKAIKRKDEFVLLPEVFVYRGKLNSSKITRNITERINGPLIKLFKDLAKKHGVAVLAGSIYERVRGSNKFYNTSVLINAQGKISAKYRKVNMFDAVIGKRKIRESDNFLPGKQNVLTKVNGFNVGLSICYDLRFPELYRKYAKKNAQIICVPSAFTQKTGRAHWKTLLRARAIENMCYILAPNQCGRDPRGIKSYGHSMIIDPWGTVIAEASGNKEEIIMANIDKKVIARKRKILPALKRRKG